MAGKPPSLAQLVGKTPAQVATTHGGLPTFAELTHGKSAKLPTLAELTAHPPAGGPAPKKSGGGFLSGLTSAVKGAPHWVAKKSELAAHDIKAMPGGLVAGAKAVEADDIHALRHGDVNPVTAVMLGKHTLPLEKATVKSSVESLRHPLRDPFETALTVLPVVSAAARVGLAGKVAAEAAKGGGSLADVARAAAKKPEMPPRLLRVGDEQVPLHHSTQPLPRAAQAVHDRIAQKAIDKNPEGRVASYATKRAGGSIDETSRYQQRMRDVPAQLLQSAAKRLAPTGGKVPFTGAKKLQRVEQAALELTSVNTTPAKAAAYHLAQSEKQAARVAELKAKPELNAGERREVAELQKSAPRNLALSKLYGELDKRGLLKTNESGDVIVDEKVHPKLARADVELAKVQGRGDEILTRYGVRDAAALKSRIDAPGRIREGAAYEKPTPAKAGVESPTLKAARAQRDSLQAKFDKAYEGQRGKVVTATKPRSIAEAKAELARLDAEHQTELAKYAAQRFEPIDRAEVRYRTQNNLKAQRQAAGVDRLGRKSGASGAKAKLMPTVKQERLDRAEAEIEKAVAKNPGHPVSQRWAKRSATIDKLKAALEPEMFDKVDPKALGRAEVQKFVPRKGKLERIGGALSVANERVQRLEEQAARQVKPTGIIGGSTARPGRGFVSYATDEPKAPKSPAASAASPVVGVPKSPVTNKAFTGQGIEHGLAPNDVTGQAARHYHQIMRFVNTTEHRNTAIRTGSDVRRTSRDVLVKIPGAEHAKIPAAVQEILGKKTVTVDDVEGLNAALHAYKEDMVPGLRDRFAADRQHPIGTHADEAAKALGIDAPGGHTWVDRNILGDLGRPAAGPRGKIARTADTINSAVTAATVYFKIGHIGTRVVTNAVTNIIQGSAGPRQIAKSAKLWGDLTHEDKLRALAAAGQHGFESMPHEGQNITGRIATKGANWWAKHADAPFRFNSIAYEARKAGFDTPAKFRDLLNRLERPQDFNMNAAEHAKVDWVAKRANRAQIAYDRLSEAEKRFVTRAVWFYPWIKGATMFAGHTVAEHPYKAGVLAIAGEQGKQIQEKALGDLPSYEGGLIPLGGSKVTDLSTFSPFSTPADLANAVGRPAELSGFLNPALTAGTNLIFGLNQYGGKSKSPVTDALASLAAPTPEAQMLAGYLGRNKDQSKRMFPKSKKLAGMQDPLVRALLGPAVPRTLNVRAAHSSAARERSGR